MVFQKKERNSKYSFIVTCLLFLWGFCLHGELLKASESDILYADTLIEMFNRSVQIETDSDLPEASRGVAGVRIGGAKTQSKTENENRVSLNSSQNPPPVSNTSISHSFANIVFKTGSSTVESVSYPQLAEIGKALASIQSGVDDLSIVIEGHTDSLGGSSSNLLLSQARANAVRAFLIFNHQVENTIIEAVGHGEGQPVATNATEAGRRKNRRVSIQIAGRRSQ